LAPNTSPSFQTTLAADAHLAEGQFLHEDQLLNKVKFLIYRTGTRRPTISKPEGQFRAKVNLNKKECIEAIPPHM
jgi:hypothetical protein